MVVMLVAPDRKVGQEAYGLSLGDPWSLFLGNFKGGPVDVLERFPGQFVQWNEENSAIGKPPDLCPAFPPALDHFHQAAFESPSVLIGEDLHALDPE